MNTDEFIAALNLIGQPHLFFIEENCDFWPMVTGYLLYRNESGGEPFAHITGISYTRSGGALCGDLEGFLALIEEAVVKEYEITKT